MITRYNNFKKLNEKISSFESIIDFTFLKDNASLEEIKKICDIIKDNNFYCIVSYPSNISTIKSFLEKHNINTCAVISFPDGDDKTTSKINDVNDCISLGIDEIDMVMDYKILLSLDKNDKNYDENYEYLLNDIKNVSNVCHKNGVILKVIIEVEELSYEQIKLACQICVDGGADFVQTSTGYSKKILSLDERLDKIKFIRKILPDYMNIKISGGVRTLNDIKKVLPHVDRIGTSTYNFIEIK